MFITFFDLRNHLVRLGLNNTKDTQTETLNDAPNHPISDLQSKDLVSQIFSKPSFSFSQSQ